MTADLGTGHRLVIDGRDVAPLEVAVTARARSRGLLGRGGIEGALWLAPANQVHALRMRFDLDVAFLDRHGAVLRVQRLPRNRMTRIVWRSRAVVEADAGRFSEWGLRVGVILGQPGARRASRR